jgi:hypothetical protein
MARGKHREGYRRPRTGEQRKVRQPLRLDRLPQELREQIIALRAEGKTWKEIAELTGVPLTTVHRWYDLRVDQVRREVLRQAEQARVLAEKFSQFNFSDWTLAARNALASEVFEVLNAGTQEKKIKALSGLLMLLTRLRAAEAQQQRAELEKQKLEIARQRIEEFRRKNASAVKQIAAAAREGKTPPEEAIQRLKEAYGA